jgi:8-oxo-dGTP diphosphatase
MTKQFNIRVYGLLMNDKNQVLVSDEYRMGIKMTKFPGGGIENGEGLLDCLKREWKEELNAEIEIEQHLYTTDYYVKSAFNNAQLISVYYVVQLKSAINFSISEKAFDFAALIDGAQSFRWISLNELSEEDFTFPIDKKVALLLKKAD